MSEYYTPTPDEFHIGFIYESENIHTSPKYPEVLGKTYWDTWEIYDTEDLDDALDSLESGIIRVKHLDKNDIESFGFKYNRELEVIDAEGEKCQLYSMPTTYNLIKYNHQIEISEGSHTIFKGIIKNKSELKKLLNQLNI
jgi:hypothetical protein